MSLPNIASKATHKLSSLKSPKPFDQIPRAKGFIDRLLPVPYQFIKLGGAPYLHKHIEERHKQFGPIFRERIVNTDLVSITDTNMMRTVIKNEGKYPETKHPPVWSLYLKTYNLERGLFFQQGPKWLSTRRALDKILLDPNRVDQFAEDSWMIANDLINYWQQAAKNSTGKYDEASGSFELSDFAFDLSKWSIENIGLMILGQRLDCLKTEDQQGYNAKSHNLVYQAHKMLELSVKFQTLPVELMQKFNAKPWKQFKCSMDDLMKVAREISQEAIRHKVKTNGLVDDMMATSGLTEEEVIKEMIDFLVAAADTSAASITWALYLLAKNPDVQDQARNEVLKNLNQINAVDKNSELDKKSSWAKLNNSFNYLDGFIRESMRLYPPAPFLSRLLQKDIVLGDYHLPAGVHIIFPLVTTGRMESHFENPLKVKPERWMFGTETPSSCPSTKANKIASLPFGLGLRMCIGRKMANLEIKMLLACLLTRYNVQLVDHQPVDIKLRLTTWPDKPLRIKLTPVVS